MRTGKYSFTKKALVSRMCEADVNFVFHAWLSVVV